jgi:hypothetical protein
MHEPDARTVAERFADTAAVDAALQRAGRQALLAHARAGNPVAVWHEGRVVWLSPAEVFAHLGVGAPAEGAG